MKRYLLMMLLLAPVLIHAAQGRYPCDNIDSLQRLQLAYSKTKIKSVKEIHYDDQKNVIIALKRDFNQDGAEECRTVVMKDRTSGREEIKSSSTVSNNATSCSVDFVSVHDLRKYITVFEAGFDRYRNLHYKIKEKWPDEE